MKLTYGTVVAVVVAAAAGRNVSAQALPSDPAVVKGELENGLHYLIRKHNVPPGRATVWLHMHTGSLNETDRQRGIAHYLEHMAFNGSEHFPPGELVPFFQSMGMTFGRDQNAFTNMEQTTFQLSLPQADAETLGKGMTFFADVVGRLSLLPKEIDDERQIILEERRRRLSGQQRTRDVTMGRLTPGSLYGQRETIGLEETIKGVGPQDFRDYYGKWYAASNATLIVIGDADPAEVAKVISEKFGSLPKRPRPAPQALNVRAYDTSFAVVATDPEVRGESVRIQKLEPARPATTTVAAWTADLELRLAEMAFNQRLGDKAAGGGTAYRGARAGHRNEPGAIYTAEISGNAQSGKWRAALEQMALELQRARAFGFSPRELEDAKKEMLSGAERAAETEGTATAGNLMTRLNGAVTTGEAVMSPSQRLDLLKKVLPTITAEAVAKRFAAEFEPKAVAFVAVMPSNVKAPSEAELLDVGTKALAVKPSQETEAVHDAKLMTELPKGGTVAEGAEHEATRVWSGWLNNNVRVHYRFMNEQKNEVSVRVSLIGGELLETAENRGITQASQLAWSRPTTKHLSSTDIREIMTGRKVSVRGGGFGGFGGGGGGRRGGGGGGGGGDSISLSINGSPEELETGFQLAYLLLTEPKIEPTSFTQWQANLKERLEEAQTNPAAVGAREVAAAPYPENEVRTRPPTSEQVGKLTVEGAQAWLDKLTKESPIEVVIVGDISKDRAMELAAKYLGSLAERPRIAPTMFAAQRKLTRPKGPRIVEKEVDTPTDQAYVYSGFYGADESNRADTRAMALAARVLSTRMFKEVREEAQLVYSISAGSRPGTTYPGFGMFSASAPTEPGKTKALVAKLASMYEAFAKDGPTAEEMETAQKQIATTLDEEVKQPAFWSRRLDQITFRGGSLDDIAREKEAYKAITGRQVRETFAKYYGKDNAVVVTVKPSGGGGATGRKAGANGAE